MPEFRLQGVHTALVTPFSPDGKQVDCSALEALVARQLEGKVSGLVPCGTTGEAPTLSETEQREVVECVLNAAGRKVPVMAGTGSNCTDKTIALSRAALKWGADGLMIVMPYYSKPSQEGLIRHVQLVAASVDAPIVLYNIPGRTAVLLSVDSTLRILETCPNVVGIKDATGNVHYCAELLARAGDRVAVLSGDDPLTLPLMSLGAKGVISVTSNLLPREVGEVVELSAKEQYAVARQKHFALLPVHRALFSEPSPAPIKAALAQYGSCSPVVRPPLIQASAACSERLSQVLSEFRRCWAATGSE